MSLATANAFAALQKTSKKDKKKEEKKKSKDKKKADKAAEALEQAIFSQPSISVSNWADCDTDDDDGFHAAPLPSFEGLIPADTAPDHEEEEEEEEHDSDKEAELEAHGRWDEVDEHEEEHEDEHEEDEGAKDAEEEAQPVSAPPPPPVVEPERQLSKKEMKKKEMEDLDAVLNELGLAPSTEESAEAKAEKKRKKKEKKKQQEQLPAAGGQPPVAPEPADGAKNDSDDAGAGEDSTEMDPEKIKAQLAKKAAKQKSMSRPKSGKISSIAAKEAKARAAKSKKKDTSGYNQVRRGLGLPACR